MPSNFIKNVRAKRSGKNIQSGSIAGGGSYVGVSSEGLLVLTSSAGGGGGVTNPLTDDTPLYFGTGNDSYVEYDSTGDYMVISGSSTGVVLSGSSVVIDGGLEVRSVVSVEHPVFPAIISLSGTAPFPGVPTAMVGSADDLFIYGPNGLSIQSQNSSVTLSGSTSTTLEGGKLMLGATTVASGSIAGPGSYLGVDATGKVVLTSSAGGTGLMDTSQDFTNPVQPDFLANGDMNGDIIKLGSNATVLSTLYFLSGSATAWQTASAVHTTSSGPVLLALAAGTGPGTDGMLLRGFARIPAALLPGNSAANLGAPVYVSTGSGELTFTAPSTSGDVVRIVGYSVSTPLPPFVDTIIYFNPDATWVDIT